MKRGLGDFKRVHKSSYVMIHFALANAPGEIVLRVAKTEIYRLLRDEGLEFDDEQVCTVGEWADGALHIHFAT